MESNDKGDALRKNVLFQREETYIDLSVGFTSLKIAALVSTNTTKGLWRCRSGESLKTG